MFSFYELGFDEMQLIVLASTSDYRRNLLNRLCLPFRIHKPVCDEAPRLLETAKELVMRLSHEKAKSIQSHFPDALIIGSDQVAEIDGQIIGKPDSHMAAVRQLSHASGRSVSFETGLCVYNAATGAMHVDCINVQVQFRALKRKQIEAYLSTEQPYDCCGSFKSEGLGITLVRGVESSDPTALIGLPLIRLTEMLSEEGIELPLKPAL